MNSAAGVPPAGEQLRKAREARGLTLDAAADQLRLSVSQVAAMEEGRFEALGAPVFARGHLRKYALLLGLPPDETAAAYGSEQAAAAEPTFVPTASLKPRIARPNRYLWPLSAIALAIAVVLAFWWWSGQPATVETPLDSPPAAAGSAAGAELAPPGTAAGTPLQDDAAVATMPPVQTAGASLSLEIEFDGDCWIEVLDASGRQLAFDLQPAGSRLVVIGNPPLQVLIGNAAEVRLVAAGRRLAIPAAAVRQNVAHFSLAADAAVKPLPPAPAPGN